GIATGIAHQVADRTVGIAYRLADLLLLLGLQSRRGLVILGGSQTGGQYQRDCSEGLEHHLLHGSVNFGGVGASPIKFAYAPPFQLHDMLVPVPVPLKGQRQPATATTVVQSTPTLQGSIMFDLSPRIQDLKQKLEAFMDEHIYPNEELFYQQVKQNKWGHPAILEELKQKARNQGLWNLFLPESERGAGLTNEEYAHLCEIMGRVSFAPEVFNC